MCLQSLPEAAVNSRYHIKWNKNDLYLLMFISIEKNRRLSFREIAGLDVSTLLVVDSMCYVLVLFGSGQNIYDFFNILGSGEL